MRASRRRLLALGVALGALAAPLRAADAPHPAARSQWQIELDDGGQEIFWPERCVIFTAPERVAPANDSSLDAPAGLTA